ncbi:MAG: gamma-glutamyltransferase family protein [Ilumatobacteraceae bacterium]|nr:gamma-glutamyltransferase family protein [Ilumatobacteraceae bacterium]
MSEIGVGVGQTFTTRPELRGTFGMISSTHWLGTAAGMRMLELGGNAFDAATAAGLVLQVVQPHLSGPGGDLPVLVWDTRIGSAEVLCAQGTAPAAASAAAYVSLGLDVIPGTGLLAPCIPGAMDGWLRLLRERGLLTLRQVIEPAIECAGGGITVSPEMSRTIDAVGEFMSEAWPTSAAIYLDHGKAPAAGARFANPELAATYTRLLEAGEAASTDRDDQIQAARDAFYGGFVADAIEQYLTHAAVKDSTGQQNRALLTADDLGRWTSTWEPALTRTFRGTTICKSGPWSQAPVMLQQLGLLEDFDLAAMDRNGPDYIHTIIEATKLSYADREAWYADPLFESVPMDALLDPDYTSERRLLIGSTASMEQRPGRPDGRTPFVAQRRGREAGGPGIGEPTVSVVGQPAATGGGNNVHVGDTCHVDVVDRFGNMVSATPSGGWLQSSPAIPGLGFALGTRMQMFDLGDGLVNQVKPGKRPRTTLSPSLALRDGRPWLAFGSPGGDQQDQWSLQFFLNVAVFGDDLQMAIDRATFQSAHFPSSFYPRQSLRGRVYLEDRFPQSTLRELEQRGHDVKVTGPWSLSRVCAAGQGADGMLMAGANPRGMEAYAAGR